MVKRITTTADIEKANDAGIVVTNTGRGVLILPDGRGVPMCWNGYGWVIDTRERWLRSAQAARLATTEAAA